MPHTRRQAAAALLAGFASPMLFARAASAAAPPPDLEPATQLQTSRDAFERLTAPVTINGSGPFQFMIDTGANVSCVSSRLADQLGLARTSAAPVHTVVGVKPRPMAVIDRLQIGARSRRAVSTLMLPRTDSQVDGVLGVDWLKGQRLTLDFHGSRVALEASRNEPSVEGRVVVPARSRKGQLTIVDADLGTRPISAMIDSGSQLSLCNTPLQAMIEAAEQHRRTAYRRERIGLETIFGEVFEGELIYLPFLRLGGLQLGNVPVVCAEKHVFEVWDLKDKPAILLGMDLLTQFRAVSLDFGRSKVRFDLRPT